MLLSTRIWVSSRMENIFGPILNRPILKEWGTTPIALTASMRVFSLAVRISRDIVSEGTSFPLEEAARGGVFHG